MKKSVRAALFDLDGTLLPLSFDEFLPRYLKRLGRWFFDAIGVDVVPVSMAAAAKVMQNDGSRSNTDAFFSAADRQLGTDRATFERLYREFILSQGDLLKEGVRSDPSARAVVEECRGLGMRVALATNPIFPRVMIDARAQWAGLDSSSFDVITCADLMRYCKPSTGYYRQLAESLRIDPGECLMIGNDVAMDLIPAARIGMQTCLVQSEYAVLAEQPFEPDHTCALHEIPALLQRTTC